jgi:hypothetical protein
MLGTFLLGLIFVMMIGVLRTGATYWEKGENRITELDRRFVVESQLRRHLHTMISIPGPVIQGVVQGSFEGEPNRISYTAPMPEQIRMAGLFHFEIYLAENEGISELRMKVSPYNPNAIGNPNVIDDISLIEAVDQLEVSYQPQMRTRSPATNGLTLTSNTPDSPEWMPSWSGSLPPAAIRIRIQPRNESAWPELIIALHSLNTR